MLVLAALAQLLGGGPDASLIAAFRHVAELLSDRGRRLSRPRSAAGAGVGGTAARILH